VEPLQVASEMAQLCQWIQNRLDDRHPVVVAGIAHYHFVRIHPFDDGNGRGARLLMNLVLLRRKYVPAVVRNERRRFYLEALAQADRGDLTPFLLFICDALLQTQAVVLQDLA
jgi:Fic family protein